MSEHKLKKEKKLKVVEKPTDHITATPDTKVATRRVMMFMIRPTDFMFLFTKGLKWKKNTTIFEGVPEDAKVIAVVPDSMRNGIMLVVESAEYEPIPINVLPPTAPFSVNVGVPNATKKKKPARKK